MSEENQLFTPPFLAKASLEKDALKALFVGEKYQSYYKDKFKTITPQKATAGFNIAAFLLGVIWLFYRKMYGYGLIYIGFIFASSIVMEIFNASIAIDRSISIAVSVFMGLWGNTIYKHHVEKKIKQISEEYEGEDMQIEAKIQQGGGTNPIAGWTLFILIVALLSLGIWVDS